MNKARRQQLRKWLEDLENIKSELESICSDEEESFDNMPDGPKSSLNGMNSEEAIDLMNEAISSIEDAIDSIENII